MQYLLFLTVLLSLTACASQPREVVISTGSRDDATDLAIATLEEGQETDEVGSENAQQLSEGETSADGNDLPKQHPTELNIEDEMVTWGFTPASRSADLIDTVIVHSVYNPFAGEAHSLDAILGIFKGYDVIAHYIIGRSGQIYQTVDEKNIAWHAGRSRVPDGRTQVNNFSIGIEMINSLEDEYTDEQYASLRALIKDIDARQGIDYIFGHDEIAVEDPWNFDWETINDLRHEKR